MGQFVSSVNLSNVPSVNAYIHAFLLILEVVDYFQLIYGGHPTSLALTQIGHASAVAEHSISTGHNIKWDHFEILASGQCDLQCKIKETLLIRDLKPALNENVGSENLLLY